MRSLRRLSTCLLALLSVTAPLAIAGCGSATDDGPARAGSVEVVATTTQVGDFVRTVGGERVEVVQVLQPNSDPHEYEPRPDDVRALLHAPLVFESGDDLDAWMGKVLDASGADPRVVVLAAANVTHVAGERSGSEASRYDAHWWHDPRNVEAAIPLIRDALSRANPAAASIYARNARTYLRQLRRLDAGIATCMRRVPATQRKLVTDHDAFGYFAKRYDIDVVGAVIPSQSTQAQPSAGETARLISLIKRENVRAVFPESSINPKLAETIARETGASADYTLYGDTLGPKESNGDTYLKMEAANANAMVEGFTGDQKSCNLSSSR